MARHLDNNFDSFCHVHCTKETDRDKKLSFMDFFLSCQGNVATLFGPILLVAFRGLLITYMTRLSKIVTV